jgi:putative transposase
MMVGFIDDHRQLYRVEPICDVLPIAPSTYCRVNDVSPMTMPRVPGPR